MLAAVLIKRCLTKNVLFSNLEVIPKLKTQVVTSLPRSLQSVHTQATRNPFSLCKRVWFQIVSRKTSLRVYIKRHISDANASLLTRPKNNVFLYKNEVRTMRLLRVFSVVQFFGWLAISAFIYHPALASIFNSSVTIKDYLRRCGLHLALFLWPIVAGLFITSLISVYLARSVKYIILHKDGQLVSIVTYALLRKNNKLTKGVNEVSTAIRRSEAKGLIFMKVRDIKLYYLIQTSGEFVNKFLYDNTVGYKKNW